MRARMPCRAVFGHVDMFVEWTKRPATPANWSVRRSECPSLRKRGERSGGSSRKARNISRPEFEKKQNKIKQNINNSINIKKNRFKLRNRQYRNFKNKKQKKQKHPFEVDGYKNKQFFKLNF